MAVTYGFYDSLNHDRLYNAQQMSAIFDGIINDGVFMSVGNQFHTVAGTGMQVIVKSGRAWFDSTWTLNDAEYPLSIDAADVLLTRIDAVVLEVNSEVATRANTIKVIKGTPASTPAKPTLTNTATVHQHALAYVTVAKNITAITNSMIEIVVGKTETPYVTAILQTTDITDLFKKWENDFQVWFETVKGTLDGDVALNLQNQIDRCVKKADKATSVDVNSGTANKWVDTALLKTVEEPVGSLKYVLRTVSMPKYLPCDGRMLNKELYNEYANTVGYNVISINNIQLPRGNGSGNPNYPLALSSTDGRYIAASYYVGSSGVYIVTCIDLKTGQKTYVNRSSECDMLGIHGSDVYWCENNRCYKFSLGSTTVSQIGTIDPMTSKGRLYIYKHSESETVWMNVVYHSASSYDSVYSVYFYKFDYSTGTIKSSYTNALPSVNNILVFNNNIFMVCTDGWDPSTTYYYRMEIESDSGSITSNVYNYSSVNTIPQKYKAIYTLIENDSNSMSVFAISVEKNNSIYVYKSTDIVKLYLDTDGVYKTHTIKASISIQNVISDHTNMLNVVVLDISNDTEQKLLAYNSGATIRMASFGPNDSSVTISEFGSYKHNITYSGAFFVPGSSIFGVGGNIKTLQYVNVTDNPHLPVKPYYYIKVV